MSAQPLADGYIGDATYSPDDNKLRLCAVSRLSDEEYARAKAAGFRWAPKLEQFICPAWSPEAEDLLLEWCGCIGDEASDLLGRAEDRAERFEGYSDRRAEESESALRAVDRITDGIPMGQPILVGHHSERHARRDAKKIEDGMRRALKLWDTSAYWSYRAKAAKRHAEFVERPDVRARRIKRLEGERRKKEREHLETVKCWNAWHDLDAFGLRRTSDGQEATREQKAEHLANHGKDCGGGGPDLWREMRDRTRSVDDAAEAVCSHALEVRAWAQRWLDHLAFRLTYEKAMLGEQGASELLDNPKRPKPKPMLNYRATGGTIKLRSDYRRDALTLTQHDMTRAEYAKIHRDYKGTCHSWDGSHRVRTAMVHDQKLGAKFGGLFAIYLTDSKDHGEPNDGGA